MIFITANILFLFIVFTGIGLLFPWSIFLRERRFESLLICFWLGWALAIAFLQLWHFFFPVGLGAFLVLLGFSVAGWLRGRAAWTEMVRAWNKPRALLLAGLAVIPAGMVANHVMFSSPNSDYALYHLQTVKWFSEYAIVPGLGNVYFPLAFNCASFLYTAAIDSGFLDGRAYYVSNSLLAYAVMLHCASGISGLFEGRGVRNSHFFNALMIPVILLQVSTAYVVAYSPDPIVFFLQVILASELLRLFEDPPERAIFQRRAAQIILLAAAGISLKLSFAVFGLLSILLVAIVGIQRFGAWPWRSPKLWLGWLGLGSLLMVPWMARSVTLSGYLLFPNAKIPLPVPWRLPAVMANEVETVIRMWALTVNASIEYTADLNWFLQWWNIFPFFARQTFLFGLGLGVLGLLLFFALRRRGARPDPATAALFLICIPAIIFWFLMAPYYRFSGALLWIFFSAALIFVFRLVANQPLIPRPDLLAFALILVVSLWISPNHFSNNLSRRLMLIPPTEQELAAQAMPPDRFRQVTTIYGVQVYLPPEGVEECWNAPLPCTTPNDYTRRLRFLEDGNIQKGFYRDWD